MTTDSSSDQARHGTTYLWITAIGTLFALLCVSGVAMMTVYSPSATSAWASVFYLQDRLPAGWLVRGMHRFASDGLIIVCAGYLLHRVLTHRYATPYKKQWWLTLAFIAIAMSASLTGALLPWDQKAYWGTVVRANIASLVPGIGDYVRPLLLGGSEPGQLTLTRFYTLHVVIIPVLFLLALRSCHRCASTLCKRCGDDGTKPANVPTDGAARSRLRKSLVRLLMVVACVGTATFAHYALGDSHLHAPADASVLDYPARPEWFNLFLFQWLKYFESPQAEVFAAVIVPGAVTAILALLPWFPRLLTSRWGSHTGSAFVLSLFAAIGYLTIAGFLDDKPPSPERLATIRQDQAESRTLTTSESKALHAHEFQVKRTRAAVESERAITLARRHGVPPDGPLTLLRQDPTIQGPRLFAQHCASCHRYDGHDGMGLTPDEPATSSDLHGFGSREWLRSLLDDPMDARHFGLMKKPDGSPAHTRMQKWTDGQREDALSDADRESLSANFDAVSAYLDNEALNPGNLAGDISDESDESPIARGRRYFMSTCNECHAYQGEQTGTRRAPEMYGYGSIVWIEGMISEPDHETRYRSKGRQRAQMPRFDNRLESSQITLLARWLHENRISTSGSTPMPPQKNDPVD